MSTPPRDDEPAPDEPAGREPQTDHDAAWLGIVANFGERAELDPEPDPEPSHRRDDDPRGGHPAGRGRATLDPGPDPDEGPAADESDLGRGPEERFRPPPPPPLPWVAPSRLLAWCGVLGVPVAVLVMLLVGLRLPSWVGALLAAWFVGGFCYLVASMRRGHDEPGDGAVV